MKEKFGPREKGKKKGEILTKEFTGKFEDTKEKKNQVYKLGENQNYVIEQSIKFYKFRLQEIKRIIRGKSGKIKNNNNRIFPENLQLKNVKNQRKFVHQTAFTEKDLYHNSGNK